MDKDFSNWHQEKGHLHQDKVRPFCHEREVWFASVGLNIGFEQDGRGTKFLRPVVILKKFNNEVCWCLPLTKNQKKGKYYFSFKLDNQTVSTVILSQLRLIDTKRLQYKLGDITKEDFVRIKEKLKGFLA